MKTNHVIRLVQMAMLSGIAIVLVILLPIPLIPSASFLIYDMADVPVLIGAMLFGILPGLSILAVVSVIQAFFTAGGNGWVGLLMHLVASGSLVTLVGLFYFRRRKWTDTVIGMVVGTLSMTLIMVVMNLVIDPLYYGYTLQSVIDLLVPAIIPFNLLKGGINCILTGILFKALTPFINRNRRIIQPK